MDNELLLYDRLEVIRKTVEKYGEENFYLSFSGGKDSTVLHHLLDMAIPGNRIPRVFANTGIEYAKITEFVTKCANADGRFKIIKPEKSIKKTLEENGYPFKSKMHSKWLYNFQKNGMNWAVKNYIGEGEKELYRSCPKSLKYQFTPEFKLKVSDQCCKKMKEEPMESWAKIEKSLLELLA